MKKVFSLLFSMLGFIIISKAQSTDNSIDLKNSTPEQRAQWQSNAMKTKLGLNDAQFQQVSAINLEYAKKGDAIKNSGDGKFSKYRKFKSMISDKDEKLKKVLTPDQFTTYEEMKKEMMDKAKEAYKDKQ